MIMIRRPLLFSFARLAGTEKRVAMSYSSTCLSANSAPAFDKEKSAIYEQIARNHHHENGPWTKMVETARDLAGEGSGGNLRLLDLATGPGQPAVDIAKALPHAKVVATDVSEDQVAIAEKACSEIDNMKVCQADMEDLTQFPDNHFDLVTCCYGFMFPPNKEAAVSEAHRVLKPGGSLVATTWNKIPFMKMMNDVVQQLTDEPLPVPPINPLALREPGLFVSLLKGGGFVDIQERDYEYPFDFTEDPEFQLKAIFMIQSAILDDLEDGWGKAQALFETEKTKIGRVNESDGHLLMLGNEYKLTVASKPQQ